MTYEARVSLPALDGEVDINLTTDSVQNQLLKLHGPANKPTVELLILGWCSLLDDSPVDSPKPSRILSKLRHQLVADLFGCIRRFSDLADTLSQQLERDSNGDPCIGVYIKGMEKTPVFKEYLHFRDTGDSQTLVFLLTFLWFGKKSYYEDPTFDSTALTGWEDVEKRLESLVLPTWIENLRAVVGELMSTFTSDYFLPAHGTGRVAERGIRGTELKNITFGHHPRLDYLYHRENPMIVDETRDEVYPGYSSSKRMLSAEVSRLKFVPKNFKTSRSICMEPTVFMWAQQAVRLWVERAISTGRLKNHVVLSDQSRNQEASRLGSLTGTLDTIDLSSASDSVSWELVKAIFPSEVVNHLNATRTRLVELPDGSVRAVSKYAPMGSALCFPVQSTIYAAVCYLAAIAEVHGVDWSSPIPNFAENVASLMDWTFCKRGDTKGGGLCQEFLAYGDDIVVDTRTTSNVIDMLVSLGFKVNVTKSFVGPKQAFRESCGEFHWMGRVVTPFFFKTRKLREEVEIDALASVIALANRARDYGFVHLRKTLIQYSLRCSISGLRGEPETNPILFSTDRNESMAILCDVPRNTHLRKRSYLGKVGVTPYQPLKVKSIISIDSVPTERIARLATPADLRDTFVDLCSLKRQRAAEAAHVLGTGKGPGSHIALQRDEVRSITLRPVRGVDLSKEYDNYRLTCWWRSRYGGDTGTTELTVGPAAAETVGVTAGWRWSAS